MFKKIKTLSLLACSPLILLACHSDDDLLLTANAPKQVINVNSPVYAAFRAASGSADSLFATFGAVSAGDEKCEVKIHKMNYDTIGGAGESTTSSGVVMLPHGDNPECTGPRPVVLYAHGTSDDRDYDLSVFPPDSEDPNAAANETTFLLAAYAANGYAVIAPNYAGYADSSLTYHPYLDEKQQSTEMIDALEHVREYADILGAEFSDKLLVTGLSQGGYVAMATHKALEAKGETVTASLPISGPYAMLDYIDTIFDGYVAEFSTVFAPMLLTSMQMSDEVYSDPSDVYASPFDGYAENSLPRTNGFIEAGIPLTLFSGSAPSDAESWQLDNFDDDIYLLSDAFRALYQDDAADNGESPVYPIRKIAKERDMRDGWQPTAPVVMCGASSDQVVYFDTNTQAMSTYWDSNPYVSEVDVALTMAGDGLPDSSVHGFTGVYCTGAFMQYYAPSLM